MISFSVRNCIAVFCAFSFATFACVASAATKDEVICIQETLGVTAFDPGPIDGLWGRKTSAALSDALDQADLDPGVKITKGNAAALCSFLKGPRNAEFLERSAYKFYTVTLEPIDPDAVDPRVAFKFSRHDVAFDYSDDSCSVKIFRHQFSHGDKFNSMAVARVRIEDGFVVVEYNSWTTGGLADPSYLEQFTNVAITRSGQPVGKIPYFYMHVGPGEVAQPPKWVTLGRDYEPGQIFPDGRTYFDVPGTMGSQEGIFELRCN